MPQVVYISLSSQHDSAWTLIDILGCKNSWAYPLNPKSDQHLISPYSNTAELFIKIMRIKETIANLESFDCWTDSPCQYQGKYKEESKENMDTDVRV